MNNTHIFIDWYCSHCTGFARLVWGRLRVHRALVYSHWVSSILTKIDNTHITLNEEAGRAHSIYLKPHCNTLQQTATDCNTLQHTAAHCSTLQHTATHCNSTLDLPQTSRTKPVRWHSTHNNSSIVTATHCNTLQHTATHYPQQKLYRDCI